jgi:hypothetical protein
VGDLVSENKVVQFWWFEVENEDKIQGSQTCEFLATLCKFHSLFWSPVNIYIDVKQKFCLEIRVLHTRIRGAASPEGSILPKKRQIRPRTEFLIEIVTFLSLQLGALVLWNLNFRVLNCRK